MTEGRDLEPLDREACLQLLAGGGIGRVVFTDAAMPAAQPISFQLVDEEVIFRTVAGSKLGKAVRGAVVAFETDEIDARTCSGWSVLAVGRADAVRDPVRLEQLGRTRPEHWGPLRAGQVIAISLHSLHGRRNLLRDGFS